MTKKKRTKQQERPTWQRRWRVALALAGGLLVVLILVGIIRPAPLTDLLPFLGASASQRITNSSASLSSFYAPEVMHWRPKILEWARKYHVNPNVIAIVIQIESCGSPDVISPAGAVGLMQVMPYHFANGENMLNPDTNVENGMDVFYECLNQFADWKLGVALACYNGGPGVTQRDFGTWPEETQSYYRWATGMWDDATHRRRTSKTLSDWLAAGGRLLCSRAADSLDQVASESGS